MSDTASTGFNSWVFHTLILPADHYMHIQLIPPLPPSVLALTFDLPLTYEAVVTASGEPKAVQTSLALPDEDPARTLSPINIVKPKSKDLTVPLDLAVDWLRISNGSSSFLGKAGGLEAGSSAHVSGGLAKIHVGGDGSKRETELFFTCYTDSQSTSSTELTES
ncbi:hypothetical protein PTTG_04773 [Puccinia triticina 1-1 BBBD Race 1]|uniref:Uncharacterized protein n=1 Tax=Puccinia triticina (isolate 1-1 / race 1 (BBBD)) TaxID=630390 RepID=A0A0C4EVE0_PUCT1|nr:hypothetical protein PTTG_04773 [Puccinia triticina 1-1 BBBD Race 1]